LFSSFTKNFNIKLLVVEPPLSIVKVLNSEECCQFIGTSPCFSVGSSNIRWLFVWIERVPAKIFA
jgi:hypothetical protein